MTPQAGRYARPTVRQRASRGRRLWVFELRCRCGWAELVGGTGRAALAAADAHWRAHRDPLRRRLP